MLQRDGRTYFCCGLDAGADHINAGVVDAVVDAAPLQQLLHLLFEGLAEEVVDHGVVHGGALGEHARQEADFRRDGAAVTENRPQADQAVRHPAAQEADADQHGDLQSNGEDRVSGNLWKSFHILNEKETLTTKSLRWSLTMLGTRLLLFIDFL